MIPLAILVLTRQRVRRKTKKDLKSQPVPQGRIRSKGVKNTMETLS